MRISLDKKDISGNNGSTGLEIVIQECTGGDYPSDGVSVYIEHYDGRVQVHIWDGTQEDCQTITLKQYS